MVGATRIPVLLLMIISYAHSFQASFGKRFVYEYTGHVATGVVQKNLKQIAGFNLQAKVEVQWQLETQSVFFKLSNVRYGEFNEKTNDFFELSQLGIQTIHPEDNSDIKEYIEELQEPFWITAGSDGTVNIEHGLHWNNTANFKLSIAALFQISINPHVNIYTEIEEGITGRCPVVYQLQRETKKIINTPNILNITKVILYDNCETRPHELKFSIHGYKCSYCDEDIAKPLKTLGKTDYQIRVDHNEDGSEAMSFEKIDASGAIIFAPFGTQGNNILSFTNQTLKLVDVTDEVEQKSPTLIAEPAVGFVFPRESSNSDALAKAKEKLADVIKVFDTFDTQSLSIAEFVILFRKFTLENFKNFFSEHVNLDLARSTVREGEIRISLLQALSLTGTEASVQFILHLTTEKMIGRSLAAEIIRVMPMHLQKASAELLRDLTEFAQSKLINENEDILQEAIWLAYGTIVKKTCRPESLPSFPRSKLDSNILKKCSFYVQNLIFKFHSSETVNEQLLFLRTIQNTQTPEGLDLSISVVKSQLPDVIRRTGIWGVMQVDSVKNLRKVTSLVMQVAFNTTENYLLRIYAFEALIYVNPTPELFAQLVVHLNKEPNEQISSYIYSTLVTMANTTDPCLHPLAQHAKEAMLYIKSRRDDLLRYTKNRVFSYYNTKYQFGRTFQIVSVASNESVLPQEVYIGNSLKLFGYSFNMLEMIFSPRNADNYFYKHLDVYGREGLSNKGYRPEDIENSFLDKVYSLLSNKRERNVELSRVILKYFGQDIATSALFGHKGAHCLYERNTGEENVRSAKHDLLMRCIKFTVIDVQLVVPNDMGFLTTLQLHLPLVYKMGLKANSLIKKSNEFKSDFHFKFGTNFMVRTSMSVENPIKRKYGYALKTHGGLKISFVVSDANLDLKGMDNKIKLRYHPTTTPYTMFFHKSIPETFTPNTRKIVKHSSTNPQYQKFSIGHDYLGIGLTFNFTHDNLFRDYGILDDMKSFFHKSSSLEDYYLWSDKLFGGVRGNLDNLLLNPTGKLFEFSATYNRHPSQPTDKFSISIGRIRKPYVEETNKILSETNYTINVTAEGVDTWHWLINTSLRQSLPLDDLSTFAFQFSRSPIPNYDINQFEMCFESESSTSNYAQIFIDPLAVPAKISRYYNALLIAGVSCSAANQFQIQLRGTASQEEIFRQNSTSVYNRCQKNFNDGFERSLPCWLLTKQRGVLDKFEFDFISKENWTSLENIAERGFLWVIHKLYDNLELVPRIGKKDRFGLNLDFKPYGPYVDISVFKPEGGYRFRDVFVPSVIPHFESISVANTVYERFLENAFYIHEPKCVISGDYVQTTDRVVYKYPLSNCYHVVLADCSSERLILLMREHQGKKDLKLFLGNQQIQITSNDNTITINDIAILEITNYWFFPNYDAIQTGAPFIYKLDNVYIIDAPVFGINVVFDGRNAVVTVTNWLRGLQCGLCGNFDGEKTIEFVGPRGEFYTNHTDFAKSYVIQDDECL